jgi:hypothetical protein
MLVPAAEDRQGWYYLNLNFYESFDENAFPASFSGKLSTVMMDQLLLLNEDARLTKSWLE